MKKDDLSTSTILFYLYNPVLLPSHLSKNMICFLIDDDRDDREIFSMALEDAMEDSQCISVANGFKAIEQLEADPAFIPDYIFIDLNMPLMSGKDCLKEIKKIPRLQNVPVVIYTTSSYEKDVEETKVLGADHFVVKPPSIRTFTKILKRLFDKKELDFKLN